MALKLKVRSILTLPGVLASGAGILVTLNGVTYGLALDQAFSPTWTGIHTFSNSLTAPGVNLTGATSGAVSLLAPATGGGILTLPPGTDTLVGRASTDTLSNKTLASPLFTSSLISTSANASIELGALGSVNTPYIDLHSSGNSNDYDVRLGASGGGATLGGGTLNLVGSLAVTPQSSTLNSGLNVQSYPAGTAGTNLVTPFNQIRLTGDSAVLPGGAAFGVGLLVFHDFGTSTLQGSRTAIMGRAEFTGPSSASNAFPEYVGVTGMIFANTADGGTGLTLGTARGSFFASNFFATAKNGATNLLGLVGSEVNTEAQTGSSTYFKFGWNIVSTSNDKVQGSVFDAAYSVSSQTGSVNWKTGLLFSNSNGQFPIATAGTMIGATSGSVTHGLDFNLVSFSGFAIRTPYFNVDGSGNGNATNFTLSGGLVSALHVGSSTGTTGTQLTLKTTGGVGTTDAIAFVGGNNGATTFATLNAIKLTVGGAVNATGFQVGANQVVGARDTGWVTMTGTSNKNTSYDTSTVTLAQLAGRVMALNNTFINIHGLIGA